MTQLMLFDAPANVSPTGVATPAVPTVVIPPSESSPQATQAMEPVAPPAPITEPSSSRTSRPIDEPGLHHMGDLARLVILRYQLLAQRRAQRS